MCKGYLLWKHLILEKERTIYHEFKHPPITYPIHSFTKNIHTLQMGERNHFPKHTKKHKFTIYNQSSLLHFVTKFLLLLWKFGLFLDQDGFCSFPFLKNLNWKEDVSKLPLQGSKTNTTCWRYSSRHWHLWRKKKSLQYVSQESFPFDHFFNQMTNCWTTNVQVEVPLRHH